MRSPNTFTNPVDDSSYEWPLNHARDGEEEAGISRTVDHTATTGQTALLRQQGADDPLVLGYRGTILEQAHHDAMVDWAQLSRTQTIYFEDFAGNSYEVFITAFTSRHVGVTKNPRDPTNAPLHKWEYSLRMEVINVLSGDWS